MALGLKKGKNSCMTLFLLHHPYLRHIEHSISRIGTLGPLVPKTCQPVQVSHRNRGRSDRYPYWEHQLERPKYLTKSFQTGSVHTPMTYAYTVANFCDLGVFYGLDIHDLKYTMLIVVFFIPNRQ